MKSLRLHRKIPGRLLEGRRFPNLSRERRTTFYLTKCGKMMSPRKRPSTKTFQNPRLLRRRIPARTTLGGHPHPHIRQGTNRRRVIGIPTSPPRGSTQNMGTLIRCIPVPALSSTRSHITHREHTLRQCRVTRHRCMDIVSPRIPSEHPKRMNR